MSAAPLNPDPSAFLGGHARLLRLPDFADRRGRLTPLPFDRLPFVPRHSFFVREVPAGTVRGGHGHRTASQFLICLSGRIAVAMHKGGEDARVELAAGSCGLLIGPGVWSQQTYLAEQSVLLVLASEAYDPASYFEDIGHAP